MAGQTNEDLALLAKAGDMAARDALYQQNKGLLYNLLRRYFPLCKRHGMDDEDVLQQGFFVIVRAVEAYEPAKGFKFTSYLQRSAQLELRALVGYKEMDAGRREEQPAVISANLPVGDEAGSAEIVDFIPDPTAQQHIETLEETDAQRTVRREVAALPVSEQQAIRLHYLQGCTHKETGQRMGISMAAARQWCGKGLQRLRRSKTLLGLYGEFTDHYRSHNRRHYHDLAQEYEVRQYLQAIERRQIQRIRCEPQLCNASYGKQRMSIYYAQMRFLAALDATVQRMGYFEAIDDLRRQRNKDFEERYSYG